MLGRIYHTLWGRLEDNRELRRYYLHKLFAEIGNAAGARFTMSWFFFSGGISVEQIIGIVMTYAATCLLIMEPTRRLINFLGVRRAFLLHVLPKLLSFTVLLYAVHLVYLGQNPGLLLNLWMVIHAFKVMLSRVATTAYFTHFGQIESRGSDLGLATIFQKFAAIVAPVALGALIEVEGISVFIVIQTVFGLIASLMLGLKKDEGLQVYVHPFRYWHKVPLKVTKSFFFQNMPYFFMTDLFFIWLVIQFDGSYTVAGAFYGLKLAADMFLSWLVGKYTDLDKIRSFYITGVLLMALFWLLVPFSPNGMVVAILQFTVGLAGLVVDIPFERTYYNMAKQSGDPVGWALWREVSIQSGILAGGFVCLIILQFVTDWHWLIMLGAPASIAWLYLTPEKNK